MKSYAIDSNFDALIRNYQQGGIDHHEMSHIFQATVEEIKQAGDPMDAALAFVRRLYTGPDRLFAIDQSAGTLYDTLPRRAIDVAIAATKARTQQY